MLNTLKNLFGKDELVKVKVAKRTVTETRGRKTLSKKQKVLNLTIKRSKRMLGNQFRSKFDLESPRAMIDTLKS